MWLRPQIYIPEPNIFTEHELSIRREILCDVDQTLVFDRSKDASERLRLNAQVE